MVTHLAIAKIKRLLLRAAIAAHRHPACIHNRPAFVSLVANHRGEHRERNVFLAAHAHIAHHQIKEHIHARAHFRHTIELLRIQSSRRGANAHHRARQTRLAQALGGAHAAAALLLGHGLQRLRGIQCVAAARMRHHATQCTSVIQNAADLQQVIALRLHARAVAIGVDLDPDFKLHAVLRGISGNRRCSICAVSNDFERAAFADQLGRLPQFRRGHAHRIQNIANTRCKKLLSLFQRRYRDTARAGFDLRLGNGQTFGGFDMRAKSHA